MDHGRSSKPATGVLMGRALTLLLILVLAGAATWLWSAHARAWNPGSGTALLGYDAAQYALAARELAEHGRMATSFALPIELAAHPHPPWPLAAVQPGLVLAEAGHFRLFPRTASADRGAQRASDALVLLLPFASFLALAMGLGWIASRWIGGGANGGRPLIAAAGGLAVGLSFALDPEAQHFASGGFTELPFTLGLFVAAVLVARGSAARRPLLFGLVLGVSGLFRGNMLWLAPLFAAATAWSLPTAPGGGSRGRRIRVAVAVLAGYAAPLLPWWLYKWQAFGSPAWDLTRYTIWDGVGGWSWFTLFHLPIVPELPGGIETFVALWGKVTGNVMALLLSLLTGPRALWLGTLAVWLVLNRSAEPRQRALRAGALVVLGATALNLLAAAASIPWTRYVFPSRVLLEAAGLLAAWDLLRRWPQSASWPGARRLLAVGAGVLAVGWGAIQTQRGLAEASSGASDRGIPSSRTLNELAQLFDAELEPGEAVMSNLGPTLAWYARRPVVHLALTPEDVDDCRRYLDVEHVVLAFRGPERAWRGWDQIVARPAEAPDHPDWNIRRVRQFQSEDGFTVVWLEMGPLSPRLAQGGGDRSGDAPGEAP